MRQKPTRSLEHTFSRRRRCFKEDFIFTENQTSTLQKPTNSKNPYLQITFQDSTTEKAANYHVKDIGLKTFLARISKITGLSFASSIGLSYALAIAPLTIPATPAIYGGIGLAIGGIYALSKTEPVIRSEKGSEGKIKEVWENPLIRKLAYCMVVGGMGLIAAPVTSVALSISPVIIPLAAGLSIILMGGSSFYALNRTLGQLTSSKIVFEWLSGVQLTRDAILDYKEGGYDYFTHAKHFSIHIWLYYILTSAALMYAISKK